MSRFLISVAGVAGLFLIVGLTLIGTG